MPTIDKIRVDNVDYDIIGTGENLPIGTELSIDKITAIPTGWTETTEVEVIDKNDFFTSITSGFTITDFYAYRMGDVISIQRLVVEGSFTTTEKIIGVVNSEYTPYCVNEDSWIRWYGSGNTTIWIGRDAGDTDVVLSAARTSGTGSNFIAFNTSYITNARTKRIKKTSSSTSGSIYATIAKNAGAHNSIYRGEDITDLFYNGTLTTQIAAGTFDDIFIGDYIIGQTSGTKYLVADIDYRLNTGEHNLETTTHHILMIPEKLMGTAKMNDSNTTIGAYIGSKMYTEYLTPFKTIINNDFGSGHILQHRNYFKNTITSGYESAGAWYDSTIELMNELMVYGSNVFHNITHGTNIPKSNDRDKSQLSIFRYRPDLMVAYLPDGSQRQTWFLRDVASSTEFAVVTSAGTSATISASGDIGVRPAFLVY